MKPPAKTSRSYAFWIADLKNRWRATQIKAARNRRSSHSLWNKPVCYLSSAGVNKPLTRQKCHKLRQNLPGAIANSLLTTRLCNLLQNWPSSRRGITAYQIKRLLPTPAQLAKCFSDAEAQLAAAQSRILSERM
ncbi:MAG: hypothetical protein ILM98_09145 [Kiritimatiellae bacterium]|nr:hypothetical protein [Kiritimatiellia bacterium]